MDTEHTVPARTAIDATESSSAVTALNERYRVHALVGRGGMAGVYQARDEQLGRDVAVKIFNASAAEPEEVARQEAELKILAGLNHHSLVTLLDAGVVVKDGAQHLFLVTELVEGIDLRRRLASGVLSSRQIAHLGFDLAEALEYLRLRGIIHRDIKPSNVLTVEYGTGDLRPRAKLIDFGIALAEGAADRTDGTTTGTAAYLSPEQARGGVITGASDVYSLGLVLLECFTRVQAFPGEATESALARLQRDPVIPDTLSPAWRELLVAMTDRDPGNRPLPRDIVVSLRSIIGSELGRHSLAAVHPLNLDEDARMDAVRRYDVLDTPPDGSFDRVTALAARLLSVPIAIVSVVDEDRIWFKSHFGTDVPEIPRDPGLCASAILHDEPWVVQNARIDPRALANPLVAGEFGLQFYAGVALRTRDGFNLGTLCVLDFEPREISDEDLAILRDLAAMVVNELELRLESRRLLDEQVVDAADEQVA